MKSYYNKQKKRDKSKDQPAKRLELLYNGFKIVDNFDDTFTHYVEEANQESTAKCKLNTTESKNKKIIIENYRLERKTKQSKTKNERYLP